MSKAPTEQGKAASAGLHREAKKEELEVEHEKGSHLKKGEERVDERSRSAGNPDVGTTQRDKP